MASNVTVVSGDEKYKSWPEAGDVFYYQLSDGRLGYGLVSLGKIDVGPFKNAIIIYIFNNFTSSLCGRIVLKKDDLLLPPIITDASCWKNGYFITFKNIYLDSMHVYPEHYFKNPLRNQIYNHCGERVASPIEGIPVGEESIQFQKSIIKSIESRLD